ncbi:MAG: hypothetical protein ABI663_08550 [Chryseolinea sp.]
MKKHLYFTLLVILFSATRYFDSYGQGCVAVRQMGGINPLTSSGYTLPKGQFQIGTSYRYFHSFRHFVGSEEQPHRQTTGGGFDENGKEKGNAVNIYSHSVDLNLSYAITDRIQVNLSIPYVHNERSQVLATKKDPNTGQTLEGTRYSVFAQGLGDIRINTSYWVFNPATATKGNLLIGAGLKLNTGSHSVKDEALQLDGTKKSVTMDQAIQPGDGGIGFSIELQGFKQVYKSLYAFANGYYLFNPRESNGTFKGTAAKSAYDYYACPDQYFGRAGVMVSILKSKSLTFSAALRTEGIPAYDRLGGQVAYRRPGYVVAIESGVSYSKGNHSISLFVPYNFFKKRIRSASDIASSVTYDANSLADPVTYPPKKRANGDAAFADYSISVNYSYRLGKLFQKKQANLTPQKVF